MFAIFEDGGNQYCVKPGEKVFIALKDAAIGSEIIFKQVLLVSDDKQTNIGTPFAGHQVKAKIIDHIKGDKLRIVKQKSKKRYLKVTGHRQRYTKIEIINIEKISEKISESILKTDIDEKNENVKHDKEEVKTPKPKKALTKKPTTTKKVAVKE